ncbi:MAG: glycosyltransferase, partial [Candidatus Pacearchaeota archaeon]
SIIIPAKNEEETLPLLLDSIRKQGISKKDLEIIVADSHSTDKTRKIAKQYDCIIVDGGMPGYGRNRGADVARGDVLVFKDADGPLPPNFLIPSLKEFNERELDVAGTLTYVLTSKDGFARLRYKLWIEFFANRTMQKAENTTSPLMMTCMFAKRRVHEAIRGFDESLEFGEDSEYAKRTKRKGYNFGLVKSAGPVGFNVRRAEGSFLNELKWLLKNVYFTTGRRLGHEFIRGKSWVKYWES